MKGDNHYQGEIKSSKYQAAIYIDTYYNRLLAYEGYKEETVKFLESINVAKNSKFLDVGCGTGWFLALLRRHGWKNLSGLDISPDMLAIAKEMVPDILFLESPIQEIDESAGGGYDVITCLGTLHHMPDLNKVAGKLFSLLKPQGWLVLHEPNENWFYGQSRLWRVALQMLYTPLRIKNHLHIKALHTPWKAVPPSPYHEDIAIDELNSTLEKVGFMLVKTEYKNTLMRVIEGMLFRSSIIDRLLYRLIRFMDRNLFDLIAGNRAGCALVCLRKPPV